MIFKNLSYKCPEASEKMWIVSFDFWSEGFFAFSPFFPKTLETSKFREENVSTCSLLGTKCHRTVCLGRPFQIKKLLPFPALIKKIISSKNTSQENSLFSKKNQNLPFFNNKHFLWRSPTINYNHFCSFFFSFSVVFSFSFVNNIFVEFCKFFN